MASTTATHTDICGQPIGEPWAIDDHAENFDVEPPPIDGDIVALKAWVGYDPDRAKAALLAELSRDRNDQRDSIIEMLQTKITETGEN